jgi:hypothetical protein
LEREVGYQAAQQSTHVKAAQENFEVLIENKTDPWIHEGTHPTSPIIHAEQADSPPRRKGTESAPPTDGSPLRWMAQREERRRGGGSGGERGRLEGRSEGGRPAALRSGDIQPRFGLRQGSWRGVASKWQWLQRGANASVRLARSVAASGASCAVRLVHACVPIPLGKSISPFFFCQEKPHRPR